MGALPARLRAPGKARRQRRASAQAEGGEQAPVAGTLAAPVADRRAVRRRCANLRELRSVSAPPAPGRRRQRQDRGLSARDRRRPRARAARRWCSCPRSRSHPSWRRWSAPAFPDTRIACLHSGLNEGERLAALAGRALGPCAHRARHAARGVHAHARARHHRRRRGTRRLVQAGGRIPLLGARSRGRARAAARRAGRARLGDARARDLPQRRHRALRPAHADRSASARRRRRIECLDTRAERLRRRAVGSAC